MGTGLRGFVRGILSGTKGDSRHDIGTAVLRFV